MIFSSVKYYEKTVSEIIPEPYSYTVYSLSQLRSKMVAIVMITPWGILL